MVRGWAVRTPSPRTLLLAASTAPLLAAPLMLALAHRGGRVTPAEWAGVGLVLVAYELCLHWRGLDRLLISRDSGLFVARQLEAAAAVAAIAVGASLALPGVAIGPAAIGALLATAVLLVAVRSLLPLMVESQAALDGVLVIGRRDLAAKICLDLLSRRQMQSLVGAVELGREAGRGDENEGRDGAIDPVRLRGLVRRERITRIIVAEPDAERREAITPALLECRLLGVRVEDAVDLYDRVHGKLWLEALDPGRLVFATGFRITPGYQYVKRALDLVCALAVLAFLWPVMVAIAIAVRLDSPGPALFRQERVGRFGRPFRLYKFRSMRADAERATGPVWAREHDDRVTRLGRFLRKSHLDELPQVFNVLRGELSFVGPRPERACFVERLRDEIPFYDLRHYVIPGITGWAQVRYPYASSVEDSYEKLQFDLAYAKNLSLGLDVAILFRTAWSVVAGKGR